MGIVNNVLMREERRRSKLIKDAMKDAGRMASVLGKRFGAAEVILYGSLAEQKYFDKASDIDIAVKGIGEKYFKAYGYCLRLSKFNLDIRQYEDMPQRFKERVDKKGISLYAKRRKK
jgi:predicted nucleotidyltransferase